MWNLQGQVCFGIQRVGFFFFFFGSTIQLPYVLYIMCACSVAQSCLTLCNPMDCSPSVSSVMEFSHGIFQARILEWVAIFLLQGIFPTQGSNPHLLHLLHWQADSLPLHHLGSPSIYNILDVTHHGNHQYLYNESMNLTLRSINKDYE